MTLALRLNRQTFSPCTHIMVSTHENKTKKQNKTKKLSRTTQRILQFGLH